jgi:hypothetical protein
VQCCAVRCLCSAVLCGAVLCSAVLCSAVPYLVGTYCAVPHCAAAPYGGTALAASATQTTLLENSFPLHLLCLPDGTCTRFCCKLTVIRAECRGSTAAGRPIYHRLLLPLPGSPPVSCSQVCWAYLAMYCAFFSIRATSFLDCSKNLRHGGRAGDHGCKQNIPPVLTWQPWVLLPGIKLVQVDGVAGRALGSGHCRKAGKNNAHVRGRRRPPPGITATRASPSWDGTPTHGRYGRGEYGGASSPPARWEERAAMPSLGPRESAAGCAAGPRPPQSVQHGAEHGCERMSVLPTCRSLCRSFSGHSLTHPPLCPGTLGW